ncbi:MAG: protein kinase [Labilithrix sp.]|nr:protein kinase [Labilithrix sp.]MCW5816814.1 protein kinase [Labilithrix sp.]
MRELGPGARLGRYEVLAPVAEGGMARVWIAEQTGHLGFRKLVALKTMRPELLRDRAGRAMFVDEALLASRVRHPNVVEIHDLGCEGEVVYQAMTLVDGASLDEWLAGASLPVAVAIRIALDVLRGLHAAHEVRGDDGDVLGLVHRDVSPSNILVGLDGVAKISDFGIAKAKERLAEETRAGAMKGKRAYVAPEQLDGCAATRRSDVFAAGVVLWEMLTGEYLYGKGGRASLGLARLAVPDPHAIRAEVPGSITAVVLRALREDPEDRYATAREMADALEDAAHAEDLDACHQDVASRLELDLGRTLQRRRAALRDALRRGRPAPPRPRPAAEQDDEPTTTFERSHTSPHPRRATPNRTSARPRTTSNTTPPNTGHVDARASSSPAHTNAARATNPAHPNAARLDSRASSSPTHPNAARATNPARPNAARHSTPARSNAGAIAMPRSDSALLVHPARAACATRPSMGVASPLGRARRASVECLPTAVSAQLPLMIPMPPAPPPPAPRPPRLALRIAVALCACLAVVSIGTAASSSPSPPAALRH